MSSIVLSGDTSGTVTVAVPAVAGTNTVTIAAQTGTLNAAGPAFSAYQSTLQSVANSTFTKIQLQTENFDTNNNFDSTTNYRFTPTVAGYYQINGTVSFTGSVVGTASSYIYKNGSNWVGGSAIANNTNLGGNSNVSSVVYLNGSTDYVELYAWQNSGSGLNTQTGNAVMQLSGCLVRGA
jgi:hypothetical protein